MRATKAIIAICFSIAWAPIAAQTKTTAPAVVAKDYQCGEFSAFLVGHVSGAEAHAGSGYGEPDNVLFVVHSGNIFHRARSYTLVQVPPKIAALANADFMWQCTSASAADGCKMAARMIASRPNTPDSLSLQITDGKAVRCVETNGSAEEQGQSANVSADSINIVRDALTNAADNLLNSVNQSDYVQNAIAAIDRALDDANQAAAHVNDDSGAVSPSAAPNFDAPAPPAPRTNFMLYSSLNSLKSAYDALNRVPGGDLAGYRARIHDDIAAAAAFLVNGIASYNVRHPLASAIQAPENKFRNVNEKLAAVPLPTLSGAQVTDIAKQYLAKERPNESYAILAIDWRQSSGFQPPFSDGKEWQVVGDRDAYAWFVTYLEPAKTAEDSSAPRSIGVIRIMDTGKIDEMVWART